MTAPELLAEIQRLYPRHADPAISAQIHALSRRYVGLEGWTSESAPVPQGGDMRTRRFFRTASEPAPKLTRVW